MPYLGNEVAPLVQALEGKELKLDSDGDSSITADTDDQIDFKTGGTDRMHLVAEKLGIGTSSPSQQLHLSGSTPIIRITDTDTNAYGEISSSSSDGNLMFFADQGNTQANTTIRFSIDASEVCRIEADGDMYLGANFGSAIRGGHQGLQIDQGVGEGEAIITRTNDTSSAHLVTRSLASGSGTHYILFFENSSASNIGSITHNDSATSFNTSSDYRLKENVSTDWDATTRLKQLKPSRFNWKANKDKTVDGFLAHEVSSIVPEAITGDKDAVDENGNPQYQGIDQSKLVPLLVKTVQELEARIAKLEAV